MNTFDSLLGKTIKSIALVNDILSFDTDSGTISYYMYADCCSSSWFEDVIGVKNFKNGKILEIKEEFPKDRVSPPPYVQECEGEYPYKFIIKKGRKKLEGYVIGRNESNGYYGGSIDEMNPPSVINFKKNEIKKDYSAYGLQQKN